MKTLLAAVVALSLAGPARAGDPLADAAVAVCLAKLRLPPAPAPAAAPAFERVSYDAGRTWVTRPATPAFATPVRDAIYQFAAPSGCANGQCPTPRRSYR